MGYRNEGWLSLIPTAYRNRIPGSIGFTFFWWRWSFGVMLTDRAMLTERKRQDGEGR